jgi:hypothetical protein
MKYRSPEARRRRGRKPGRKRHKARQRERNKQWYNELKKGLSCKRCGYSHPAALQFHHIKGKSFEISDRLSRGDISLVRARMEMGKCEVLCANCHAIEHHENGYGGNGVAAEGKERHPEFAFSYLKDEGGLSE